MNHDAASFRFQASESPVERADLDAPARACLQLRDDLLAQHVFELARVQPEPHGRRNRAHRNQQPGAVPQQTPPPPRRCGIHGTLLNLAHSTSAFPVVVSELDSRLASITSTSPCLRRLSSQLPNNTFTFSSS